MTGNEIRRKFLEYFEEAGHRVVASASVVPQGDPTLLFVNAGMVPFKRVFLGDEEREYSRAVSCQKCMRVSGKHNDLEEVGSSPDHQTFFEMLGNFSFGDYFKKEAIGYGWDFLTRVVGLDPEDLVVSVHEQDDEAYELWRDEIGLAPERIFQLSDKENFWQMGDTGPCGPCSEIHKIVDRSVFESGGDPSGDGYVELWNLVFMQFEQAADGTRKLLPKPSIDTGMGLDRLTRVLQGVSSNYETDLFRPMLDRTAELAGIKVGQSEASDLSIRVVADHARACTFLIGDGVLPLNEGRGYVLRRVLRRAARHGVLLGLEEPFLYEVAGTVIDQAGAAYPELRERRAFIQDTVRREEERFLRTLGRGLQLIEAEVEKVRRDKSRRLSGDVVFKLYDTYGFPTDLTHDILSGHGLDYDQDGFDARMREQAERARAAWKGAAAPADLERYRELAARTSTEFTGYEKLDDRAVLVGLLREGQEVSQAAEGEAVELVVDRTPFYAESGGQVGDVGSIEGPQGTFVVEDTQRPVEGLVVHVGHVSLGTLQLEEELSLVVDPAARAASVRNHSGTHLLQWALRAVLGPQVAQAGSLVAPDRLRFDFTHDDPLSDEEIRKIEDIVNGLVFENLDSRIDHKPYRAAIEEGAIAMFDEKYGDEVRVVRFGPSIELCGGTHARATGDIGCLRIVSQSAIGAGVRRIEAQTGFGVLEHARQEAGLLREISSLLRAAPAETPVRVKRLLEERRELEGEIEQLRAKLRRGGSADPFQAARDVGGVRLIAAGVPDANPKELRSMVDDLKQRLGSGLVFLVTVQGEKTAFALGVTQDLVERFRAGDLVRQVAEHVGGSGGGRPDFAQGGAPDQEAAPAAIECLTELVEGR